MKLIKSEKIETNKYLLEIAIGAEEFEVAVEKAYRKAVKQINMPGFRKGKAPRKMVERVYGEGTFHEDAVNSIYPSAYNEAIEEAKLEPVDKADIEMSEIDKNGFTFKATVTVKPEVSVKDYKGIKAVKYLSEATSEEVTAELDKLRERAGRIMTVEGRAAKLGDTAVINFEGFTDGIAFEGGKGENFPLQLGSGQFIPGFETQVVGKNVGDEFDVELTFPEEYGEATLAGKPALFKCKLCELKAKELPELDDELAKDMSEFSTLAELEADIKTKIKTKKDSMAQDDLENRLIDSVIDNMEAEIPECMIEQRIDQSVKEFEYRLQSQRLNLNDYLQYTGSDIETFRKTFAEQAEKQVKIRLALEKIVKLEEISASAEELEKELAEMAEKYGMSVEKIKQALPEEEIAQDIAVNKAIDLVRDSAVVTTEEATAPAAPAKKAAAKKAPAKKAPAKAEAGEEAAPVKKKAPAKKKPAVAE